MSYPASQNPPPYGHPQAQPYGQQPYQPPAQPAPQWPQQPYDQPGAQQAYGRSGAQQAYGQAGTQWPQQQSAQPGTQWPQAQPYDARAQQFAPAPAYAPQAPYDQQFAPQQAQPYAAPVDPNALQCRFCGCVPAARVKFRGHRGMIVIMTFLSLDGPFCRDCGLSTFRRMTASTLIAGWWGYASFLITPITVLINLTRRGKVADLPAPVPPPNGPSAQPMDPGKPLLARPQALIGLALPGTAFVLFLILIIIGAATGGS